MDNGKNFSKCFLIQLFHWRYKLHFFKMARPVHSNNAQISRDTTFFGRGNLLMHQISPDSTSNYLKDDFPSVSRDTVFLWELPCFSITIQIHLSISRDLFFFKELSSVSHHFYKFYKQLPERKPSFIHQFPGIQFFLRAIFLQQQSSKILQVTTWNNIFIHLSISSETFFFRELSCRNNKFLQILQATTRKKTFIHPSFSRDTVFS